jgi:serine/threonine protein kinase
MSSQVYRARHQGLDRIVALKLFSSKLVRDLDPKLIERFHVEMQAVGRLAHPHVVHAYDAGPVGGTYFLAMEYVEGVNLQRLVEERGPLPLMQASDYVRQAALGLQHVLENGLVHRDVKPANLMVTAQSTAGFRWGQVKILDLGLARLHAAERARSSGALTQTGQVMGTADYMAPEQALDPHQVDIRTDLYSLGCTFYFLLAGHPPFAGGSFMQRMNRHLEEEAPPLASVRRDVPAELSNIIGRLMAKDPARRFATPADLAQSLSGLMPRLPAGPGSSAQPRRKRWWLLGAAGIALILVLSIVVASATRNRPDSAGKPAQTAAPAGPKTRYVLDFDGFSQFVALPDNLVHNSTTLTVEVWFKTKQPGGIFGCQRTLYPEVPTHDWTPVLYVGVDGTLYGAFWRGECTPLHGARPVTDDVWHHVALTSNGTSQSLFQDGERVDTAAGGVDHLTMHHNQIGMAYTALWPKGNGKWSPFTGMIRDVRIWHLVRTPEQVRQDMAGTTTASEPGLAAWYPLDERQGTMVRDRSRHAGDGKLGGGDRRFQPKRAAVMGER